MDSLELLIIGVLAVIGLVLVGFVWLIVHFVRGRKAAASAVPSHLRLAFSSEDAISQLLIILALAFGMLGLFAFDRELSYPVSWQTLFLIVVVAAGFVGYRMKLLYPVFGAAIGTMVWLGAQGGEWVDAAQVQALPIVTGIGLLGVFWYSIGASLDVLPKYRRFATSLFILGLMVVAGLFFFLSSNAGLDAVHDLARGSAWYGSFSIGVSVVVVTILAVGAAAFAYSRKAISNAELGGIAVASLFMLLLLFIPSNAAFSDNSGYSYYTPTALSNLGIGLAIVYNIAIFGLLVGTILSGYTRKESWRINLGAVLMFLLILVKYFDWFFTFLDKSIFFLGAGLILFLVGYGMERARKMMLASINTTGNSNPLPGGQH